MGAGWSEYKSLPSWLDRVARSRSWAQYFQPLFHIWGSDLPTRKNYRSALIALSSPDQSCGGCPATKHSIIEEHCAWESGSGRSYLQASICVWHIYKSLSTIRITDKMLVSLVSFASLLSYALKVNSEPTYLECMIHSCIDGFHLYSNLQFIMHVGDWGQHACLQSNYALTHFTSPCSTLLASFVTSLRRPCFGLCLCFCVLPVFVS